MHADLCALGFEGYLSVLQRKPGAIRNGAPFAELPNAFQSLQTILLKRVGGDREMVDILALVLLNRIHRHSRRARVSLIIYSKQN